MEEDKTRYKNDIIELNKKMEELHEQIVQIEEKLGKLLKERDEINADLIEIEKQKHIKAADIERIAEQIESFKARRRELEPQLETATKELVDAGVEINKLEPIEISIEEITSKIQRLEKRMTELGDVNMRALAAYDEVLTRQNELKEQIETLTKERKEILVRDISSFSAILFGAKALSRAFSTGFAKLSGFALNIKPESHEKGVLHKIKNYFTAGHGIEVLTSEQIVTKYSNINEYKDGINGFLKFINANGGDAKKVLKLDKTVREQTEKIIKDFNGKSLKDATMEEIHKAFEKAKGSETLEKIYTVFSSKDNKFVNRAKTFNSAFGFASTIVLVPAFMMWLARYCEKMTKKAVEKENQAKKMNIQPKITMIPNSKPTMAGFIKNNNLLLSILLC